MWEGEKALNAQQMLEKYKGICQFQCDLLLFAHVEALVPELVSLLNLAHDPKMFQRKKGVYNCKGREDERVLLLVEFSQCFLTMIIRFPDELKTKVQQLLRRVINQPLHNTLIQQSLMNRIVKEYQLDIDIVDRYDLWSTTFQQKSFWDEYAKFNNVGVDEQLIFPELVEPIRFEIEQGIELSIEIGEYINQSMLMFKHPTLEEEYELGWDDLGGWHSHVLCWEELEKIVNYLTIQHSDHFVVPFLLLLPFAPISKEEDERTIARRIKAAWRSLQLFKEEEIETFDRQIPYMPDFVWSYSFERGVYHVCDSEEEVYSKRHICGGDFPFEAWEDTLRIIDAKRNTPAWQEAVQRWDWLIQQYGKSDDEDWFLRRETVDYYHTGK